MSDEYNMIPFEGVFPLGQRWVFWGDALGSTVRFRIGYDEGELTLPDTPRDAPAGRGPMGSLDPPSWLAGVEVDWGQVVVMPTRLSLIGALGLRFRLPWYAREPPSAAHVEGLGWQFAAGLYPWLHRLRGWLSALTGADLTTESRDDLPGGIPEGVRLRAAGANEWALKQERNRAWNCSTGQAINLLNWQRGVRLTSEGEECPVEHALLNAARRALEERNMRLGAIEAGAAAEMALSGAIRAKTEAAGGSVSEFKGKTLGQLRQIAEERSVACPAKMEFDKLLRPRNDAVHGNRAVSYPEVQEAIRIATQIVKTHCPLPA